MGPCIPFLKFGPNRRSVDPFMGSCIPFKNSDQFSGPRIRASRFQKSDQIGGPWIPVSFFKHSDRFPDLYLIRAKEFKKIKKSGPFIIFVLINKGPGFLKYLKAKAFKQPTFSFRLLYTLILN